MKNVILVLKSFITEVLIIIVYLFLINNYIGNVDKTINADAIGYYDYLPSIFIHHDLSRKDIPVEKDSSIYDRINATGIYTNYNHFKINKYPCGTALLELPFFTYAYLTTDLDGNNNDGYQPPFHRSVFYAAIFYLFLSVFFLKKILELYDIKNYVIIFIQFVFVLSTAVTHYANYDAGFSHVFSLFAITAFIYFAKLYFKNKKLNHFIYACIFLGLIIIIRQINILIILFIPFLSGSINNLKDGVIILFKNKKSLIIGIISVFGIFFIQSIIWYLQTGNFLIYSYQGEGFNFSDPQFFNILFSYKKGLFVYTPILFITMFSLVWLTYKRKYYLLFTWLSFFVLLTYILSSWWSWFYGCSYGLRAYIDYYTIFFIPFAIMLDKTTIRIRLIVMAISLLTIPINIVQTYQYKNFILHWINMDKEKYWKVFLKTEDKYKGLIWKKNYDYNHYSTVKEIFIGDIDIPENTSAFVYNINSLDIPNFEKVSIIQVLFDSYYQEKDDTKIGLKIIKSSDSSTYYYHDRSLIQFHEKELNKWQTGLYNYEFSKINKKQEMSISLKVISGNKNCKLTNVRIKFLKHI
jgi:hypothetical protein